MAFYLAFKEIWRNRGRFFLFSLVIALITILVLFVSALADGLGLANKEYISKLDAQLLVFQSKVDLRADASRLGRDMLNDVRRVEGVQDVGTIGFSSGSIVDEAGVKLLDVSLIGVEAGKPGAPTALEGKPLQLNRGYELLVDGNAVLKRSIKVGNTLTIRTLQGTKDKYFNFTVRGTTDRLQYLFQPSLFIPYQTWDEVRAQGSAGGQLMEVTANVIAVQLINPADVQVVAQRIREQVANVDVSDIQTAIEAIPGYSAQQGTLNSQRAFALLIGILVIGGFFQIQTLQKVPQIGVLKAIGADNRTVGITVVTQIIVVTAFGVLFGTVITLLLSLFMPPAIPISFTARNMSLQILTLLLIGPAGGMVSVRVATRVEPLIALGLSN
jgi:putative ABC transport system permease protein